ncbi:MAG: 30S ribosomal protein S20 [Acidobacteriota bacterium]
MANHKSASKKARQDQKRNDRNRDGRTRMRSGIKKLRAAIEAGDKDTVKSLLTVTLGLVDKSAGHGLIHNNTADRYKSRLTLAANKLLG